jgi:hypothetical protein
MSKITELHDAVMHGLTPLGCAVGGTQGKWQQCSNATIQEWQRSAEIIRVSGGVE